MPKDYYQLLEIEPESTTEQIKKAYRQKAKKLHPDANPSASHILFVELQEAFTVLTDPQKRLKYNICRKQSPLSANKDKKIIETITVFYAFDPENKNDFHNYHQYYKKFREEWTTDNFYNQKETLLINDTEKKRPKLKQFLNQIKKGQNRDKNIIHNYDFIIGSLTNLAEELPQALEFVREILEHGAIYFIKENTAIWPDDSIEDYCSFYLSLCRHFPTKTHSKPKKHPKNEPDYKTISRIKIIQMLHEAIEAGAGNGDMIVLFRELLPFKTTIKIAEMLRTIEH